MFDRWQNFLKIFFSGKRSDFHDMGLIADFSEGESIQKRAFEILLELAEEHQLEQIVNQPTRGKNVLDLVFNSTSNLFIDK